MPSGRSIVSKVLVTSLLAMFVSLIVGLFGQRHNLTFPFLSRPCSKVTLIEAHAPTMLR
jgi:hypothetical protein